MARPNSISTLVRRVIAKVVEPRPPSGFAWCLDCSVNGRTLEFPASGIASHFGCHNPDEAISIVATRLSPTAKDALL